MTRTPRVTLHDLSTNLRTRIPARLRRKSLAYAGAGLALAGVAGGTAAAGFGGTTAPAANAAPAVHSPASHAAASHEAASHGASNHGAAKHSAANHGAAAKHTAKRTTHTVSAKPIAAKHSAAKHTAAKHSAARHGTATHRTANHERTWAAVSRIVADRTYPKAGHDGLPAQDRLTPVGTSGPQTWLPITSARWDNAKTIVREAIRKHMGLRSAVIAVATSMQESTLLNLNYGDRDSLGLFQQRPSCGWGSPAQIEHPAYAADAFLNALHGYQASNPSWAHRPLWEAAQGVQGSAFPSAYAKWEAQAAHLVASVTKHLV
jgi:hypothetical protein